MNAESYFNQYKLLNPSASDYFLLTVDKSWVDIAITLEVEQTIASYEENNEELPSVGEYAVLENTLGVLIGVARLVAVKIEAGSVLLTLKVVFA